MVKKRIRDSVKYKNNVEGDISYIDGKLRELEGLPILPDYKRTEFLSREKKNDREKQLKKPKKEKKRKREKFKPKKAKLKDDKKEIELLDPKPKSTEKKQTKLKKPLVTKFKPEIKKTENKSSKITKKPPKKKIKKTEPSDKPIKKPLQGKKEIKTPKFSTETPFDEVISLVDKENIIPLTKITERFNIKKEIAIEWGRILSESNLIDFHQPAFGDPEFRKKDINIPKAEIKVHKKKIIIIAIITFLSLIILVTGILIFKEKPEEVKTVETIGPDETKTEELPPQDMLKKAFSGNGSYDCRDKDGKKRYAILNNLIKIESVDGSSKVVIKNNKTYTYNPNTKAWIEFGLREGLAVPGSGVYPKIGLDCEEIEIEVDEFNT